MSTFGEKLKQIRRTHDWSQEELANVLGTSKQVISRYENNQRTPKITTAQQYADILQIPLKYLIDESINLNHVKNYQTPSEFYSSLNLNENPKWQVNAEFDDGTMEMMSNYFDLNDDGQKEAQKRVSELREIPRYLKDETESKIITLDMDSFELPASAGSGMYLSDEYKEVIQVKDCYEARTSDFVIPISGDSMEPLYSDGDRVFVKSMPMVEVGEIGIFVINGDAYIKKRGRDRLISLNRKRKDIVFGEGDTIVCLGKVIGKVEE